MKWIPLSERMPDNENKVLLLTNDNRIYVGFIKDGYIDESPKTCGCNGIHLDEVTHWAELPPLPKPEKPEDPDFIRLNKSFDYTWDANSRILSLYEFLKAKYDH